MTGSVRLVNLTAHAVAVYPDGVTSTMHLAPTGQVARVTERHRLVGELATDSGSAPIAEVVEDELIEGLPAALPGTVYVVSRLTAARACRSDVLFPFGEVRDANGRIIGCRALARFVGSGS